MKKNQFINPWRIFFWEAILFCSCLVLGIITAFKMSRFFKIQEISSAKISPWQFLIFFIVATLLLLSLSFLRRFKKGKGLIFKALFVFAVFFGGILILGFWLGDILALLLMIILIFLWVKQSSVIIHNICVILGIAGAGVSLGLRIEPQFVVILLLILSVYDFIAVYKTKHMIRMAKEMIESRAILGLIIPSAFSGFLEKTKKVQNKGKFLILGGGDMAFPLVLCVSLVSFGILKPLIVALFALIGLFLSFYIFISQKTRKPIPALPPIAIFSILGYLITLLI